MSYPETIEEFIKQYSFKDTEEIYTNGTELIPVFRVMQAIEHYIKEIHNVEDVSDKYEKAIRQKPKEPLYEVDVTVDCYGVVERMRKFMSKSEFEQAKKQGYFLA